MNGMMGKRILVAFLTGFVFLATRNQCAALPVDLGAAGPQYWTVLETGAGTIAQSQAPAQGRSRSGGARHSALSNSPGGIEGRVGNYSLTDSSQPALYQARLDAIAASSAATGLSATSTLSEINLNKKSQSLTLDAGVYNLTRLQLSRGTLTLSGTGTFVFNISSVFALKSAQIVLAGGATEANVLFNYTGTSDVGLSALGKRGSGSVLHGIILALNAKVNLAAGLVVGEIISGQDIAISSGAWVQGLAQQGLVQVPDNSSTAALCCIACGALLLFRSIASRYARVPIATRGSSGRAA